jgi:IS605 OrfB family transposase
VRFTTGPIRVEPDRRHVSLPRVGRIKTHESTRKLARRLEVGTARILSATVRREGGRWYCAFTVQTALTMRAPAHPDAVIGIDLGIRNLAVLSSGECVPNPRHLNTAQRRLRSASRTASRRRGPNRRSGQRPSRRWHRARLRLARRHARVAHLRRDWAHKLTTRLAGTYGTLVVEDLNVSGMLANHRLARHIADVGFAELRRQLNYKDHLEGRAAYRRRPVVPLIQDVLGLPGGETQAVAGYPHFHLRALRPGRRPRPECRTQPEVLRRPEWLGDGNGRGADQKTETGSAGGCEASTPHRATRVGRGPPAGNGELR